jgi:hypothetical protein
MSTTNAYAPVQGSNLPNRTRPLQDDRLWFQKYATMPFPVALLPDWLAEYVTCLAGQFHLKPDAVAPFVLAQLAGVLATNRSVHSHSAAPAELLFSVIIAAHQTPTLSMALTESTKALAELQQTHLDVAAGFDRNRAQELMNTPRMSLPDGALPTGNVEPEEVDKWRARLVRLYREPLFWLEWPGSRELRAGFSGSFDRTLLVTFSKGGWLERLVAPKRDREANRQGELLASLGQGSHISVLAASKNPAAPRLIQPRFGFVGPTTSDTLTQALKDEREDVRTLLGSSVLLDLSQASDPAAVRPSAERMQKGGAIWKHMVTCLLEARRAAESRSVAAHECFYEHLAKWQGGLQTLSQRTPASLHGHLAAFANLPLKIGSLLLAVGQYGVWKDVEAARAACLISNWMLGKTILCAATAQEEHRRRVMVDARQRMLAKIVEHQPIDFWRLCRHFDKQSKVLHEPTLHALMDERLVCINTDGKLIAA